VIAPIRPESSRPQPPAARVAAFERYADLLRIQLEALERDDLAEFQVLAGQRDFLAEEIDASSPIADADAPAADDAVREAIEDVMRRCRELSAAVENNLRHKRDATLRETLELDHARRAIQAYASASGETGSLDIDL